MLAQQFVNAISLGGVYALFALGFTLIFGVLNVVNLAHGAIFMLGAYTALQAVVLFKFPLALAMGAAIVVTGTAGWLLDRLIFAPLRARQAPHLAPMIATIGLGISLNSTIQGIFGAENLRFPVHGLAAESLQFGGLQVTWLEIQIILLAFVLMAVLLWWLKHTRMGCALRALAESRKAAALLGIDVEGLFRVTSVIAALLGGVAGVLIALYTNAVFPQMGQPMLHKGIAVVILGGMGDIRGALLGGFFLGCAEVFSVAYIGSTMRDAVAFGLLFAILLLRPEGLFGKAAQRRA
ncbi:MAG: branched-chain amino acid ABC transporter permease [Candidatus Binatia bacterium]